MKTRILRQFGIHTAAAAALFLASVPGAMASLILQLTDGVTTEIVIDNAPAGTLSTGGGFTSTVADTDPTVGFVVFNGAIGVYTSNLSAGFSKPVIGPQRLDLLSGNVSGGGGGSLLVGVTDTDYGPVGPNAQFQLQIGGQTNGVVTAVGAADENNGEFTAGSGGAINTLPLGPGAFAATVSGDVGPSDNISLSQIILITHENRLDITSFDSLVEIVPEPASLGLLGISLLALGFVGRRRQGGTQAA